MVADEPFKPHPKLIALSNSIVKAHKEGKRIIVMRSRPAGWRTLMHHLEKAGLIERRPDGLWQFVE